MQRSKFLERKMGLVTEKKDWGIRMEAFNRVHVLDKQFGLLNTDQISGGFTYEGEKIHLGNKPKGIFKPRQLRYLLSIKSVFARTKKEAIYRDQKTIQEHIFQCSQVVDYSFMKESPVARDNNLLKEACLYEIPIIYFFGVAPGLYQALFPAYIIGWDGKGLNCQIAFGIPGLKEPTMPLNARERRYSLYMVQQQLHRTKFRLAVINAYKGKCAMTGLPVQRLLDATQINHELDEKMGQAVVPNGLPLSGLHNKAFDGNLIGIDPDYRIHVSERMFVEEETQATYDDNDMHQTLKKLDGKKIYLPLDERNHPSKEFLAMRFEQFWANR